MRRALLIYCTGILFTFSAIAQKNQPAFGVVDKSDLEMKDCDFDKGAEALKLIDWESTEYQSGMTGFSTFSRYRTRIKIFTEKGLSYAEVQIPSVSRV